MTQYKIRVQLISYSHVDVNIIADSRDEALEQALEQVWDGDPEAIIDEEETGDIEILEEVEDPE